jgi:hypothetical protein
MKKVKYEKPVVRRLGYDSRVMGIYCIAGSKANTLGNCNAGTRAHFTCTGGGQVGAGCDVGATPGS